MGYVSFFELENAAARAAGILFKTSLAIEIVFVE